VSVAVGLTKSNAFRARPAKGANGRSGASACVTRAEVPALEALNEHRAIQRRLD